MKLALSLQLLGRLHVVAQIVEAELVVGAVGDVAAVNLLAFLGIHVRLDRADGHAEPLIERAHPLGVAPGEIIVDGDDVDALAFQRVEIGGERRDEGFSFSSDHFSDIAAVQHHAAHQLDVVMPHLQIATARLAAGGERFGKQIVQRLTLERGAGERPRSCAQLVVGEGLE